MTIDFAYISGQTHINELPYLVALELNTTRQTRKYCRCSSPNDTWVCTRAKGHKGRHIATTSEHVLYIWEPEPPPKPLEGKSTLFQRVRLV